MAKSKKLTAVDAAIGARLRLRRSMLGLSQTSLAAKLGLTFQMIQRYEHASCRVSASMLYTMSTILDVPISFFFDGVPLAAGAQTDVPDLASTRDGRIVATMFPRIPDPEVQHVIAGLIQAAADPTEEAGSP